MRKAIWAVVIAISAYHYSPAAFSNVLPSMASFIQSAEAFSIFGPEAVKCDNPEVSTGDSFSADCGAASFSGVIKNPSGSTKFSLLWVIAPETYNKKDSDCFGEESEMGIRSILQVSESMLIVPYGPSYKTGREKSIVNIVDKDGNKMELQIYLLKKGFVLPDLTDVDTLPEKKKSEYVATAMQAKSEKRGLWGKCSVRMQWLSLTTKKEGIMDSDSKTVGIY